MRDSLVFLPALFILPLSLLSKPRLGFLHVLALLIFFYPPLRIVVLLQVGSADIRAFDILYIFIIIFLGLYMPQMRLYKKIFVPKSTMFILLFLFWGIFAFVRGFVEYGTTAIGEARVYVLPILFYFFTLIVLKDKEHIRQSVNWFLWLLLPMVLFHFIFYYFLGGIDYRPYGDFRYEYRFVTSTEVLSLSFALISVFFFYLQGGVRTKYLSALFILATVSLITIIVNQTRSMWIATVVGLIIVMWSSLRRKTFWKMSFLTVCLLFLYFLFSGFIEVSLSNNVIQTFERSIAFLNDYTEDRTASFRLAGWEQEFESALSNPILGLGLGRVNRWFANGVWQTVNVHNAYIIYFSRFGAVGIFILMLAFYYWYKEMRRFIKYEDEQYYRLLARSIQICVIVALIYSIFFLPPVTLWILLGMGTTLTRALKRAPYTQHYTELAELR